MSQLKFLFALPIALAIAQGDTAACAAQMELARYEAPPSSSVGIVSRWGEDYWRRDFTVYHAMLALCSGNPVECLRVIEPLAETAWEEGAPGQYVQSIARHYCQAAWSRLGSRERVSLAAPAVPPTLQELIRRHTTRLCGYRFREP